MGIQKFDFELFCEEIVKSDADVDVIAKKCGVEASSIPNLLKRRKKRLRFRRQYFLEDIPEGAPTRRSRKQ